MECRKHVEAEYQRQGIHMYPTFCPQKVQKDPGGHFTVVAKNSEGKEMALTGLTTVLMATGRRPNSKGLGLEEVHPSDKFSKTDQTFPSCSTNHSSALSKMLFVLI